MAKLQILDPTFENLVESYTKARNRAGASILEMANICIKAKEQLKKKKWFEWLDDNRIRLKRTQAKKLIAIAKVYSQGGQSTDPLYKKGVEEAYLLTRIKDNSIREELSEQVIEADFTVKQIKQAISKVQEESKSPLEAIEEVKNLPKLIPVKQEKKTVSIDEYKRLKAEYEKLLKEKQELENRLNNNKPFESKPEIQKDNSQELKEPVKSDKPDSTLDKIRRSIVIKGWELPIPSAIKAEEQFIDRIEIAAVNNALNFHKLDLR